MQEEIDFAIGTATIKQRELIRIYKFTTQCLNFGVFFFNIY